MIYSVDVILVFFLGVKSALEAENNEVIDLYSSCSC